MTTAKIRVLIRFTPYSLLCWGGWSCCSGCSISWLLGGVATFTSGLLGSAISGRFTIRGGFTISSGFLGSTVGRLFASVLLLLFRLLGFIAALLLLFRLLRLVAGAALLFLFFGLLGASGEGNLLGSRLTLFSLRLGHRSLSLCFSSIRLRLLLFGYGLGGFLFLDDCLCL